MPFCLHKYSLLTLRECITDRGEGGFHNETASVSASAHSVISAIPSQEIQKMIQEVEALDEETLKVKKKINMLYITVPLIHNIFRDKL